MTVKTYESLQLKMSWIFSSQKPQQSHFEVREVGTVHVVKSAPKQPVILAKYG